MFPVQMTVGIEDLLGFNTAEFLEHYEKFPCLWDNLHPKFRDRQVRASAEDALMRLTNISDVKCLRKKIRSIRGSYNTEIRKIKESWKPGLPTSFMYRPKVSWFPIADRFLRKLTNVPSDSNMDIDDGSSVCFIEDSEDRQETDSGHQASERTIADAALAEVFRPQQRPGFQREQAPLERLPVEVALRELPEDNSRREFVPFGNSMASPKLEKQPAQSCMVNDGRSGGSLTGDNDVQHERDSSCQPNEQLFSERIMAEVFRPQARPRYQRRQVPLDKLPLEIAFRELPPETNSTNEFVSFGNSVAAQLEKLPVALAVQVQADIQSLLTRARLEHIRFTSSLQAAHTSEATHVNYPASEENVRITATPNCAVIKYTST